MKLSVSTYSLHRWRTEENKTLEDTIDFIASTGVAGIEFSGLDAKAQADPIARAIELHGRPAVDAAFQGIRDELSGG